jgi:predicted MFS family arabinose efflux permease
LTNRRGARFTLLSTTAALALYPAFIALTRRPGLIAAYAVVGGICGAGLNLVLFDELMKTVPSDRSPTFVAVALLVQYVATVAAPLIGTAVADSLGLSAALFVGAALRLTGFVLFATGRKNPNEAEA